MKATTSNPAKTVLTIVAGFLVIYYFTAYAPLLKAVILLSAAAVLSSTVASYIDKGWMMLTKVLGYIMPNVILSVVFFVFLFPIAQLSKLFSKQDILQLNKQKDSVYKTINRKFTASDLKNPW